MYRSTVCGLEGEKIFLNTTVDANIPISSERALIRYSLKCFLKTGHIKARLEISYRLMSNEWEKGETDMRCRETVLN